MTLSAGALLLVCIAGPLVLAVGGLMYLQLHSRRRERQRRQARADYEQHRREQRQAEREARKERKGPR